MLINRQIITAICDVCGFEKITCDEVIPEGWWEFGGFILCPKHTSITIHCNVGEKAKIEDNS